MSNHESYQRWCRFQDEICASRSNTLQLLKCLWIKLKMERLKDKLNFCKNSILLRSKRHPAPVRQSPEEKCAFYAKKKERLKDDTFVLKVSMWIVLFALANQLRKGLWTLSKTDMSVSKHSDKTDYKEKPDALLPYELTQKQYTRSYGRHFCRSPTKSGCS